MTYTPDKPQLKESLDELRARIPGWGADLDPKDRPSNPKLEFRADLSGAHWRFPDRQPDDDRRERSVEHQFLTPVYGTTCPRRGLSGAVRGLAYRRYSEGRAAHWLLLMLGDRVDAWENHLRSFATLRPDDPVTETGVLGEFSRHPIRSRFGRGRADLAHQWLDPVVVAGPWVAAGALAVKGGRSLVRNRAALAVASAGAARAAGRLAGQVRRRTSISSDTRAGGR
ncbi:hypothetical protein [Pseudonocardia sp. NPDC049154]|uniref:hypothetical protein n=1 Tax=Pseudonocardia sp. NPDC049154 TaxID=3155501 RepID=UPI00340936F6